MGFIQKSSQGYYAPGPFVITCGCGDVGHQIKLLLRAAQIEGIAIVASAEGTPVKRYIQQEKLDSVIPNLRKSKHAILFNPTTGQYINLLKAERNPDLYDNIYKVVNNSL